MGIDVKVPVEEMRKRKLFVATPMYGGQCSGMYSKSIADLSSLCTHYGIEVKFHMLFNESLITRARNYCADEFLRSDCTHMIFIDSDIGFNANDVLALLALQSDESDYDIIAATYPKKSISWEKLVQAVNKGYGEKNPEELSRFVGDFVFSAVTGDTSIKLNEPVEVMETGTGFMMIRRKTFEKFAEAYPQQKYLPDHIRTQNFDGSREIMAYFDTPIDPESKRYLSEDYMFCQWSRKIGMKVWLCPWMKLQHVGSYIFGGSLSDLAMIQAPAQVDLNKIKK